MKARINNTCNTINYWNNNRQRLVLHSIFVGALAGLAVVFYRFLIEQAGGLSFKIYTFLSNIIVFFPLWLIALMLLGYVVCIHIKACPLISGSGIPQVEGELKRKLDMVWWKVLLGKFAGGVLSILGGLSLGRQGPSVQIGAAVGKGYCRVFNRMKIEEKFLITSGAGAGLSASFNAPLSGVIFSLEVLHKNFSPIVLASVTVASITADVITKNAFGQQPIFDFSGLSIMTTNQYPALIVLGLILGVLGILFNHSINLIQRLYEKASWLPHYLRPLVPFAIAGIIGITIPEVLGGGQGLILTMIKLSFGIKLVLAVLIIKYIFTLVSAGSGAPGGTFMPVLVIGALLGNIYGIVMINYLGFDPQFLNNFIVFAMAGYFTAIVKAPITGSILITEMTGSFNHLLCVILVCITAYVTSDFFGSKPLYDTLLERILSKGNDKFVGSSAKKVIIETAVCLASKLEGCSVKDIAWPPHCLLVAIKRGNTEIIPKGDTEVCAGDYLIVLTDEDKASDIRDFLSDLSEKCEVDT